MIVMLMIMMIMIVMIMMKMMMMAVIMSKGRGIHFTIYEHRAFLGDKNFSMFSYCP